MGRMPVLFVGHGSPMNAIEDNVWSRGLAELGRRLPRPAGILAVSAHWYVDGTFVTGNAQPRTIHDFSGFPEELYRIEYPAPGDPALARRVGELVPAEPRDDWGLDHGTWSVLRWIFPDATVPVVQLSIDRTLDARSSFELARPLAALRDEGVLVLGSGNVVHNLRDAFARLRSGDRSTPEWARRFDVQVRDALVAHDHDRVIALSATEDGRTSHPTADHFLPLVYAAAATDPADRVELPIEGFDLGSISMRTVLWA